jgi:uncharacterized protein YfdQ (DUF2303 family)
MFDKEAIKQLQEGESISSAVVALQAEETTGNLVALPSDFKVHDLEQYLPNRRRARGTMNTEDLSSFASYFTAHAEAGATVFVDKDAMKAVGVLNLGSATEPGHADNKAVLSLKSLAAYDSLRKIANGQAQTQGAVAEWMEDWQDMIECWSQAEDVALLEKSNIDNDPHNVFLANAKAIAAVRNITIDAARKVESEEGQLSASKSAFESVKASSKHTLPTHISFTTVPYMGLEERCFVLRLGILTGGDKTAITLRIVKMEEHQQEMAEEFAGIVAISVGDAEHGVLVGTHNKGA